MSHSLSFFLSVLSALEATRVRQCYQSQLFLATFSTTSVSCLFCLVSPSLADSAALYVPLPLLFPLLATTYARECTHTIPSCSETHSLLHLSNFPSHLSSTICFISRFFPTIIFLALPLPHSFSLLHLCSPSIRGEISFAARAVQYWSFLTHTQVGCNRSVHLVIDLTQRDG